ncbi:hypothetical protein VSR68_41455 [Paraburkholderia phymatum]|uniref:hypothetical protein n=1 Tax=Paraburkholderia phymatum TaxID=148447 RepID=UPI00317FE24A
MLEAALDNVHGALMGFAVHHDALFSLLLVAPAAVAYVFAFLVCYRSRPARAFMHGRTAVSIGLVALFLTTIDQYALPHVLRALSFDTMCAAIPFIMLVLGACWGAFVASLMAWWHTHQVVH